MSDDMQATIESIAKKVYDELGGGYLESVYQQAMAIEFRELGIAYEVEHTREVFYRGQRVGEHKLDFLVLGDLVVELKSVDKVQKAHRAQLRAYLRNMGKQSGLLINFPNEGDEPEIEPVET